MTRYPSVKQARVKKVRFALAPCLCQMRGQGFSCCWCGYRFRCKHEIGYFEAFKESAADSYTFCWACVIERRTVADVNERGEKVHDHVHTGGRYPDRSSSS